MKFIIKLLLCSKRVLTDFADKTIKNVYSKYFKFRLFWPFDSGETNNNILEDINQNSTVPLILKNQNKNEFSINQDDSKNNLNAKGINYNYDCLQTLSANKLLQNDPNLMQSFNKSTFNKISEDQNTDNKKGNGIDIYESIEKEWCSLKNDFTVGDYAMEKKIIFNNFLNNFLHTQLPINVRKFLLYKEVKNLDKEVQCNKYNPNCNKKTLSKFVQNILHELDRESCPNNIPNKSTRNHLEYKKFCKVDFKNVMEQNEKQFEQFEKTLIHEKEKPAENIRDAQVTLKPNTDMDRGDLIKMNQNVFEKFENILKSATNKNQKLYALESLNSSLKSVQFLCKGDEMNLKEINKTQFQDLETVLRRIQTAVDDDKNLLEINEKAFQELENTLKTIKIINRESHMKSLTETKPKLITLENKNFLIQQTPLRLSTIKINKWKTYFDNNQEYFKVRIKVKYHRRSLVQGLHDDKSNIDIKPPTFSSSSRQQSASDTKINVALPAETVKLVIQNRNFENDTTSKLNEVKKFLGYQNQLNEQMKIGFEKNNNIPKCLDEAKLNIGDAPKVHSTKTQTGRNQYTTNTFNDYLDPKIVTSNSVQRAPEQNIGKREGEKINDQMVVVAKTELGKGDIIDADIKFIKDTKTSVIRSSRSKNQHEKLTPNRLAQRNKKKLKKIAIAIDNIIYLGDGSKARNDNNITTLHGVKDHKLMLPRKAISLLNNVTTEDETKNKNQDELHAVNSSSQKKDRQLSNQGRKRSNESNNKIKSNQSNICTSTHAIDTQNTKSKEDDSKIEPKNVINLHQSNAKRHATELKTSSINTKKTAKISNLKLQNANKILTTQKTLIDKNVEQKFVRVNNLKNTQTNDCIMAPNNVNVNGEEKSISKKDHKKLTGPIEINVTKSCDAITKEMKDSVIVPNKLNVTDKEKSAQHSPNITKSKEAQTEPINNANTKQMTELSAVKGNLNVTHTTEYLKHNELSNAQNNEIELNNKIDKAKINTNKQNQELVTKLKVNQILVPPAAKLLTQDANQIKSNNKTGENKSSSNESTKTSEINHPIFDKGKINTTETPNEVPTKQKLNEQHKEQLNFINQSKGGASEKQANAVKTNKIKNCISNKDYCLAKNVYVKDELWKKNEDSIKFVHESAINRKKVDSNDEVWEENEKFVREFQTAIKNKLLQSHPQKNVVSKDEMWKKNEAPIKFIDESQTVIKNKLHETNLPKKINSKDEALKENEEPMKLVRESQTTSSNHSATLSDAPKIQQKEETPHNQEPCEKQKMGLTNVFKKIRDEKSIRLNNASNDLKDCKPTQHPEKFLTSPKIVEDEDKTKFNFIEQNRINYAKHVQLNCKVGSKTTKKEEAVKDLTKHDKHTNEIGNSSKCTGMKNEEAMEWITSKDSNVIGKEDAKSSETKNVQLKSNCIENCKKVEPINECGDAINAEGDQKLIWTLIKNRVIVKKKIDSETTSFNSVDSSGTNAKFNETSCDERTTTNTKLASDVKAKNICFASSKNSSSFIEMPQNVLRIEIDKSKGDGDYKSKAISNTPHESDLNSVPPNKLCKTKFTNNLPQKSNINDNQNALELEPIDDPVDDDVMEARRELFKKLQVKRTETNAKKLKNLQKRVEQYYNLRDKYKLDDKDAVIICGRKINLKSIRKKWNHNINICNEKRVPPENTLGKPKEQIKYSIRNLNKSVNLIDKSYFRRRSKIMDAVKEIKENIITNQNDRIIGEKKFSNMIEQQFGTNVKKVSSKVGLKEKLSQEEDKSKNEIQITQIQTKQNDEFASKENKSKDEINEIQTKRNDEFEIISKAKINEAASKIGLKIKEEKSKNEMQVTEIQTKPNDKLEIISKAKIKEASPKFVLNERLSQEDEIKATEIQTKQNDKFEIINKAKVKEASSKFALKAKLSPEESKPENKMKVTGAPTKQNDKFEMISKAKIKEPPKFVLIERLRQEEDEPKDEIKTTGISTKQNDKFEIISKAKIKETSSKFGLKGKKPKDEIIVLDIPTNQIDIIFDENKFGRKIKEVSSKVGPKVNLSQEENKPENKIKVTRIPIKQNDKFEIISKAKMKEAFSKFSSKEKFNQEEDEIKVTEILTKQNDKFEITNKAKAKEVSSKFVLKAKLSPEPENKMKVTKQNDKLEMISKAKIKEPPKFVLIERLSQEEEEPKDEIKTTGIVTKQNDKFEIMSQAKIKETFSKLGLKRKLKQEEEESKDEIKATEIQTKRNDKFEITNKTSSKLALKNKLSQEENDKFEIISKNNMNEDVITGKTDMDNQLLNLNQKFKKDRIFKKELIEDSVPANYSECLKLKETNKVSSRTRKIRKPSFKLYGKRTKKMKPYRLKDVETSNLKKHKLKSSKNDMTKKLRFNIPQKLEIIAPVTSTNISNQSETNITNKLKVNLLSENDQIQTGIERKQPTELGESKLETIKESQKLNEPKQATKLGESELEKNKESHKLVESKEATKLGEAKQPIKLGESKDLEQHTSQKLKQIANNENLQLLNNSIAQQKIDLSLPIQYNTNANKIAADTIDIQITYPEELQLKGNVSHDGIEGKDILIELETKNEENMHNTKREANTETIQSTNNMKDRQSQNQIALSTARTNIDMNKSLNATKDNSKLQSLNELQHVVQLEISKSTTDINKEEQEVNNKSINIKTASKKAIMPVTNTKLTNKTVAIAPKVPQNKSKPEDKLYKPLFVNINNLRPPPASQNESNVIIPNNTLWTSAPKPKHFHIKRRSKVYASRVIRCTKKYCYKSEEVQSFKGTPMRVTYLVEDPSE